LGWFSSGDVLGGLGYNFNSVWGEDFWLMGKLGFDEDINESTYWNVYESLDEFSDLSLEVGFGLDFLFGIIGGSIQNSRVCVSSYSKFRETFYESGIAFGAFGFQGSPGAILSYWSPPGVSEFEDSLFSCDNESEDISDFGFRKSGSHSPMLRRVFANSVWGFSGSSSLRFVFEVHGSAHLFSISSKGVLYSSELSYTLMGKNSKFSGSGYHAIPSYVIGENL
jgi:hypothetical protein